MKTVLELLKPNETEMSEMAQHSSVPKMQASLFKLQ